jgi:hypothetical protein
MAQAKGEICFLINQVFDFFVYWRRDERRRGEMGGEKINGLG